VKNRSILLLIPIAITLYTDVFVYKTERCSKTVFLKKVKQSRYTPWRRMGERRYSSYSFSTSALDGVSGQRHAPAALLSPEKEPPIHIVQEVGWAPEPVWTQRLEEKSFAPPGIEPRSPGRPARSQKLYCLSYTGSFRKKILDAICGASRVYLHLQFSS
jgi:hypothetical protein